jgi:hypothetical protein
MTHVRTRMLLMDRKMRILDTNELDDTRGAREDKKWDRV